MACGCVNQDLQDFGNFGMGGVPLARGRWHECLTRDHESLREIWGGGCLRVHGGQLAMAAVVGTGDNLTLKGRIGGHGGRLAASAAVGAGGGVLAGGRWVGAYSRCAPVQKKAQACYLSDILCATLGRTSNNSSSRSVLLFAPILYFGRPVEFGICNFFCFDNY